MTLTSQVKTELNETAPMKFVINRDHFCSGLQKVQNIVGARSNMPVLNNVKIETENDAIVLTTSNLEIGMRCKIKTEGDNPFGAITLPVKKLLTIVKVLPNIEVTLETFDSDQAKITSGGSHFRIMGIGENQFPALPIISEGMQLTVPQKDILRMIKSVSYAQSTDENRKMLNGVYFNFADNQLTLVATDGKRLGLITKEIEIAKENEGSFILPAKTAIELERLLGYEGNVTVVFNSKQVAFDIDIGIQAKETGLVGNLYLISKVVESNYPNYKQVIPNEVIHRVKLDRELLLESLLRVSLVTNEKQNSITLKISTNLLEITAFSAELGESHESMAIDFDKANVELVFNPQFLIDPLRSLTNDEVFFEFKDELSPGLFRTNDSFLCVIMPLRLT
jgi:DNA polymerase-3 subunit beta